MSANTTNQQITYPVGTDLADNPPAFLDMLADVEGRLVQRYTSDADRLARNPAPTTNELSIVGSNTWYDRWTGTKWLPVTPMQAIRNGSQVVNNSTTLVNDTQLFVALPLANTAYAIEGWVRYDSSIVADFKFALTCPAGADIKYMAVGVVVGGTTSGDVSMAVSTASGGVLPYAGAGVGTITSIAISGGIILTATTGNLQLQWAQNSLDPTNTTVGSNSWLRATAVG